MAIGVPTLLGAIPAKKSMRALLTSESLLLLALWGWFTVTYIHAQGIPLFGGNMTDAQYEMNHISKILVMTFVMILIINSKERFRKGLLSTAGSLGMRAFTSALFGFRTQANPPGHGRPDAFQRE